MEYISIEGAGVQRFYVVRFSVFVYGLSVFTIPFFLIGCGQIQYNSTANVATLPDGSIPVTWSSLPSSEQHAIIEVSKHYGEDNPSVVFIHKTETDSDQKLMYVVGLSGYFRQDNFQTNDLEFSILGDGTRAWDISNKSWSFPIGELTLQ